MDSLELLDTVANPTAATAIWDGWLDSPPPLFGRHPDEEEDLEDEALDDDELISRARAKITEWQAAGTPSLDAVQDLFRDSIRASASPMARGR